MTIDRASAIYSIVNEIENKRNDLQKITSEEAREINDEIRNVGTLGASLVDMKTLDYLREAIHTLETAAQLLEEAAI